MAAGDLGTLVISQGPQINMDPQLAASSPSNYIEGDALMVVDLWNSAAGVTVTIDVRVMGTDGIVTPTQQLYVPTSDRTKNTFNFPLEEGFLISIAVKGQDGVQPGRTFVRAAVHRGFPASPQSAQVAVQGYVGGQNKLSWPNGKISKTNDGGGAIRSITGTTPAAGADTLDTVPTGAMWKLISVRFALTTNATVSSRQTWLIIDDGSNILMQLPVGGGQPANNTYGITFGQGMAYNFVTNAGVTGPMPVNLRLAAGFRIRTTTQNLQAGDQYTAPQYLVEEFIAP